ncbi:uncharacterized protein LOC109537258 [Dendroctonus ponderosae]|uniref:DUF4371 domain-containing protein n=1 Tax=Dendroctonus ponderosae TaxID=77166 RepID=A0AAR5PEF7_DENPD|nr:uncharacterized protein LOC109537258 [Dendroctonus ponderosae]KAH1013562.1 hypothetical protein HUJ04_002541 [Dendroctonus ponderosae]
MNKVSFLLVNKFSQFCLEDQLKIKALGRDTPELNITKSCANEKSARFRKFNPALYAKNAWLCGCDVSNRMYCFPCLLYGGDEFWSEKGVNDLIHVWEKIKSHERSTRHMHNMFSLAMLGKVDIKVLLNSVLREEALKQNSIVRKNRQDLSKIINNIRSAHAFDLALRGQDQSDSSENAVDFSIDFNAELSKANKETIAKLPMFKDNSLEVLDELIDSVFGVYQAELIRQVKAAEYLSVIIDEAFDGSCKSLIVAIIRYLVNGKPVERFWNIIYPEAYDAEALSQALIKEIEPLVGQTPEKLISISYDGPSVASGSLVILQQRFKDKYPASSFVHYYAHSVTLVISSAASMNRQAKIFFSSLCSLCSFLASSPQVINIFNEIVQKRHSNGKRAEWDLDPANMGVTTIHKHRKDLVMVMDFLEKSANVATINQAGGYKFRLQDRNFIFWLGIFNKLIPLVVATFHLVQKEGVNSERKAEELKRFENAVYAVQQQMDGLIGEIENDVNSSLDFDDEYEELVAKKPRLLNQLKRKEEALEICNAVIRQVLTRFSSISYLTATNLFKVNSFKDYRRSFPSQYLDETTRIFPFIDKQKITIELQVVYERPELRVVSGIVPFLELVSDEALGSTFQELVKLLSIVTTMPIETNESERRFTVLKQIKTFLRNTSRVSNLSAFASMSIEKSFIHDIDDFDHKVIDFFAAKTKRLDFVLRKV